MTAELIEVEGGRTMGAAPSDTVVRGRAARRGTAWLGLLPFFAFLGLFLLLPTYGVVRKAFIATDGHFTMTGLSDAISKESAAFQTSLKVSVVTALFGVVLGTLLAYAAATATRPRWLR